MEIIRIAEFKILDYFVLIAIHSKKQLVERKNLNNGSVVKWQHTSVLGTDARKGVGVQVPPELHNNNSGAVMFIATEDGVVIPVCKDRQYRGTTPEIDEKLFILGLLKRNGYYRLGEYELNEVFPFITQRTGRYMRNYGEFSVLMNSSRYRVFERQIACVSCGIRGLFFALERQLPNTEMPHFNMYGLDAKMREILMTQDHIIPRSKGGTNQMDNLQTMCERCNSKKADKI